MMSRCFETVEKFMKNNQYKDAFREYERLIETNTLDNEAMAEAYNMLGVITLFDKDIDVIDDTGLFYFKQSLQFDPNNIGALLNIIATFGKSFDNHLDFILVEECINKVLTMNVELSEMEKRIMETKVLLINELKVDNL